MSVLSFSAHLLSGFFDRRIQSWKKDAIALQEKEFKKLLNKGRDTWFGKDHDFGSISSYDRFRSNVPIRDYEEFRHYIGRIRLGEDNVLWPGRPVYFALTSGTTSGGKYIPITRDSMPNHTGSTRLALFNYIKRTGRTQFLNGKYIFLSGSPELEEEQGILSGRLSGIVNHHVPGYLRKNQLPSWATNCIPDWQEKIEAIVDETIDQDMSLISGIPPWVEMYFERLIQRSGKSTICEIFPGFRLFIYGGVNFQPYEQKFRKLLGANVDTLETFPASEGFIAFQDLFPGEGLLLIPDMGIFYEFIPVTDFLEGKMNRISLSEVKPDVNYLLILNTNAGLWGYNIGDTVRFVSTDPYRILVTGRVSQFISAFGEHVIAEEAQWAINQACRITGAKISEFTVAPRVDGERSCHEWFIEFTEPPDSLEDFSCHLDMQLRKRNHYYDDLVSGNIIQPLRIKVMPENSFARYMSSIGKLGGQNKVPHLKNDRSLAMVLESYLEELK
jgi:hypothetical protein